jgi:hypothetical protein
MPTLDIPESIDHYRERCLKDPCNALARKNHSYVAMSSFQVEQGPYNTEIIRMFPTADAGMPHTRPPNYICMPEHYPENLYDETLQHELIHIHQRRNDLAWRELFHKQGWVPLADQHIPERWLYRCRLNPDTMDQRFYAWENRWVPLPLFERLDKPDLRECSVRWWDQRTGELERNPPPSFNSTFGSHHPQPEHPREVSAVIFARQFRLETWENLEEYLDGYLGTK